MMRFLLPAAWVLVRLWPRIPAKVRVWLFVAIGSAIYLNSDL